MEINSFNIVSALLLGIVILAILLWFAEDSWSRRKIPPGPLNLPFIGTMAWHGFSPDEFSRLSRSYGDIYRIGVGSNNVVVLNSYNVMKEALVTNAHACSGRGYGMVDLKLNPLKAGIVTAKYDQLLRETKSQTFGVLRILGFGKSAMENRIKKEVDNIVNHFRSTEGTQFDPRDNLTLAIFSITYGLLYDTSCNSNESIEAKHIMRCIEEFFKHESVFLLNYFPSLRILPPFAKPLKRLFDIHEQVMEFNRRKIHEHIESHTSGLERNFLHGYFDIYMNEEKPGQNLNMNNLEFVMRDLLFGGVETSSTSLKWLMIFLANYQSIQRKAQNEVDTVVGKNKAVCLADKDLLPYTEAIIWELQRYKTITPYAHPHHVDVDTEIAGFNIPKDTTLMLNLPHVHMNEKTWGDPHIFRPERFIDSNGRFVRHTHLVPFGMGKRQCPGKVLAEQELFLFTATILQKFTIYPPDGVDTLDEGGIYGLTYSPYSFQIRAIPK